MGLLSSIDVNVMLQIEQLNVLSKFSDSMPKTMQLRTRKLNLTLANC
jgi:hypothetical protein